MRLVTEWDGRMFSNDSGPMRAAAPFRLAAALAVALSLGACVPPRATPASETGAPDPALQGHAQWCNTSPPSGYCGVDDLR
jgi:hypothetical protein